MMLFIAPSQLFGGLLPVGHTSAYQVNIADAEAASPGAMAPVPAGRRMLRAVRRLAQITAAQAEAEAVVAQSVENLYSLNAVRPNGTYRYEWLVPDSAAPGPNDGEVVAYAYVSGVDHIKHINAGLVGTLLVYSPGAMPKAASVKELPLLFNIQNEMQSELYDFNLARETKATGINIDKAVSWRKARKRHPLHYCRLASWQPACIGFRTRSRRVVAQIRRSHLATTVDALPRVQPHACHQWVPLLQRADAAAGARRQAAHHPHGVRKRGRHALAHLRGSKPRTPG